MPTREVLASFWRDWDRLTPQQQRAFREALVQGHPGVWEMTWALDGRATFQYGAEVRPGETHVIWRRVGPHSVFRRP